MKKIILGVCSVILVMLIILIGYTLHGRTVRQTELDNALTSGMEKAMETLRAEKSVAPQSNEEWIAYFMEAFVVQIDSSSDLTVHVLDADFEKGLLSVEATLKYKHPIGTEGSVSIQKTMILETFENAEETKYFNIQFMVDGEVYKKYSMEEGAYLINPIPPMKVGKSFTGWKELDGGGIVTLDGKTVDQDKTYVAVFN